VDVQVYVPGSILDRLCQVLNRAIDREREHIARIPERLQDERDKDAWKRKHSKHHACKAV
jgi:tRNA(Phe) wybutosine-synthesizing methylase Tyw3